MTQGTYGTDEGFGISRCSRERQRPPRLPKAGRMEREDYVSLPVRYCNEGPCKTAPCRRVPLVSHFMGRVVSVSVHGCT
jgi:hypothetical protein